MPTFTPDVDPTLLSKFVLLYANQGDNRHLVVYFNATDAADTSPTGHGPEAIAAKFAALSQSGITFLSGQLEHPDGTSRSVDVVSPGSAGSAALAPSPLAMHMMFHDTRNRAVGHYLHIVTVGDVTSAEGIVVGGTVGGPWATFAAAFIDHTYTKTGFKYVSNLKLRLTWARSRASGGSGRRLTRSQAEKFLWRHNVDSFSNPYRDPSTHPLGFDGPFL